MLICCMIFIVFVWMCFWLMFGCSMRFGWGRIRWIGLFLCLLWICGLGFLLVRLFW